ncbi:Hypothetical protein SMAX5B_011285 [Scophthalmus maximus]|uniref:Uncharacterized protein n=1 Tax=Scophthalmus maximus TaxID=52904 RepID=A0A2U9CKR5_SCOMX|nr:Hypothetical protein SMAX5B_011285 [Scophthalmus maximus]
MKETSPPGPRHSGGDEDWGTKLGFLMKGFWLDGLMGHPGIQSPSGSGVEAGHAVSGLLK